ncbi:hypothetical protein K438DRAFT_1811311 [Mycena galopus ATCC 62051]|nr:hypothetical protein K438DRAFT_1811311 [Mycena galopus ATCC 62051]
MASSRDDKRVRRVLQGRSCLSCVPPPSDRVRVPSADPASSADEAWFRGERVRIVTSGMQLHADMQTIRVSRCNGGNIGGDCACRLPGTHRDGCQQ